MMIPAFLVYCLGFDPTQANAVIAEEMVHKVNM